MTTTNRSGGLVPIVVRKLKFPFAEIKTKLYFKNNGLLSAFGAALSGTFPPGEKEFIESVRLYQDKISDPELQQNIKDFIAQESQHSIQHRDANSVMNDLGWDAQWVEESLAKNIKRNRKTKPFGSDKWRLGITTGMEHLTAILAEFMLTHPEVFEEMDGHARDLLLWHAVEEIEHKAVAFDTFMAIENDQKFLRKTMRVITVVFSLQMIRFTLALLWKARHMPSFKEIKSFMSFMFGKKGMIRLMGKSYRDYFKEYFHPWDHDNQHLIDRWKEEHYRTDMEKNPA